MRSSNFGNNIVEELEIGYTHITNHGGSINTTTNSANSPISGAMLPTMGEDGYPALSDGTSLRYLFNSGNGYVTKKNSGNINGLFRYNASTGEYSFNRRENHAEFNGTNRFVLYDAWISSNFIMYPFGNFLPFNKILDQTTPADEIDRDYFLTVAARAQNKYNNGRGDEYNTLSTVLNKFVTLMDTNYGSTGWSGITAMKEYFQLNSLDYAGEMLGKVYSIDYDYPTNFFFGMNMEMHLMQPKGGMTGPNNQYPMVFYFTGDDDIWIYLDDVLFLDLSGIHRHVGGEIDFVNGEIRYYTLDPATGDVSETPYKRVSFAQALANAGVSNVELNSQGTFVDYSTHKFNFYYMERGAGSGVCRMNFNFPLLQKNSITVMKEVSGDTDEIQAIGNPDYKFQVYKANSDGTKTNALFIAADTEYTIYEGNPANGNKIGTGRTDENGVFMLKAGQSAQFTGINENVGKYYVRELLEGNLLEQYGNITVSGQSTTSIGDVTVGSDTFKGVDSPVKDMSDGATMFSFNNRFVKDKLGSLSITKNAVMLDGIKPEEVFGFVVKLDGVELPEGMVYDILNAAGEKTGTGAAGEGGVIAIHAGETAVIPYILAGTEFEVMEITNPGYTVDWSIETENGSETRSGNKVSGTIVMETTVALTATNTQLGTKIPVVKSLHAPDTVDRIYSFNLVELTGPEGTEKANGVKQQLEVTIPAGKTVPDNAPMFVIPYNNDDIGKTFYYLISENAAEGTRPNLIKYLVTVPVVKKSVGVITAIPTYSKLIPDASGNETAEAATEAAYVNVVLGDLTITKQVNGVQNGEFEFAIDLQSVYLPGTYETVKTNAAGVQTSDTLTLTSQAETVQITLKHGERFSIKGLPVGTTWTVTETNADGFKVDMEVGGVVSAGSTLSGEVESVGTVINVTNTQLFELPHTGGSGTFLYTMGGLLLMAAAVILLYSQKRRGKGVLQT